MPWNIAPEKNPLKQALNDAIGEYLEELSSQQAPLYSPDFPMLDSAIEIPVFWETTKIYLEHDCHKIAVEILVDGNHPSLQKKLAEKLIELHKKIPQESSLIEQAERLLGE